MSKLERFAIILASAVHDLGHPGVNNAFLVRSRDPQALLYNDRSVNEMMHASLAFRLAAEKPALNLFKRFSDAEYDQVGGSSGRLGCWGRAATHAAALLAAAVLTRMTVGSCFATN